MKGSNKRGKLFEIYNKNWKITKAEYKFTIPPPALLDDTIMCPLCGKFFTKDYLDTTRENHLTLEDVPPAQLGGKPVILTCKLCNNFSGHKMDAQLIEYLKVQTFLAGEASAEIKIPSTTLNYSGGKITCSANLSIHNNHTFLFKVNIKKGEPRHDKFRQLDKILTTGVDFHFHSPPMKIVNIAILRIAYLLLFQKFGHLISFNSNYNAIRKQILFTDLDVLQSYGILKLEATRKIHTPEGIYVDRKLNCFIVNFDLKVRDKIQKLLIFIPSPFTDAETFYKKFASQSKVTFSLSEKFTEDNFLTDPLQVFSWLKSFRK